MYQDTIGAIARALAAGRSQPQPAFATGGGGGDGKLIYDLRGKDWAIPLGPDLRQALEMLLRAQKQNPSDRLGGTVR